MKEDAPEFMENQEGQADDKDENYFFEAKNAVKGPVQNAAQKRDSNNFKKKL